MLKKSRSAKSGTCTLTFALPTAALDGPVSVVGTFNGWVPGVHALKKRSNGTSSASVTVPTGTVVTFRYLGDGGKWFDEIDADRVTAEGSVVTV